MLSAGPLAPQQHRPEMVRWGADFARAAATVESGGRDEELEVVVHAKGAGPGARKRIRVNGVNRRAAALRPVLRTVLFAPEDMLLIVGSPSLRAEPARCAGGAARADRSGGDVDVPAHAHAAQLAAAPHPRGGGRPRRAAPTGTAVIVENGARILDWRHETLDGAGRAAGRRRTARSRPRRPACALRYASNVEPGAGREQRGRAAPSPARDGRQGGLERRHAGRAAPRRLRLRVRRARADRVRLARPAAHGHPGPQAGRAGPAHGARRPPAAAAARRCLQRARSRAPRPPRASHRQPAPGHRDDHHARRPRPGAGGRLYAVARGTGSVQQAER